MTTPPARSVACRQCEAPAGDPCVTAAGRPATEPHAARRREARTASLPAVTGPDTPWPDLATELHRRRLLLGLSQRTLAQRAGITRRTIANAEQGMVPNGPSLDAIVGALGCEIALVEPGEMERLRARVAELEELAAAQREALSWQSLKEVRAENRRLKEALDALARQPVITHDLIDQARAAVAGTTHPERTAA